MAAWLHTHANFSEKIHSITSLALHQFDHLLTTNFSEKIHSITSLGIISPFDHLYNIMKL